jgi:hypothetical protein
MAINATATTTKRMVAINGEIAFLLLKVCLALFSVISFFSLNIIYIYY